MATQPPQGGREGQASKVDMVASHWACHSLDPLVWNAGHPLACHMAMVSLGSWFGGCCAGQSRVGADDG